MRILIIVLLLPLMASASEQVSLQASCNLSGQITITVDIDNTDLPEHWLGLQVVRELIGSCDKPEEVTVDLLPLPAPGESLHHELSTTADGSNLSWRYTVQAVDTDGNIHATDSGLSSRAYVSWGQSTFFKGKIEHIAGSRYRLVGCDARCWPHFKDVTPGDMGVTELQMVVWATHNTTLYVVGEWNDTPLANGGFADVSDVKITSSCGALMNELQTWSALKTSYR
jgi:hypothetical protein